MNVSELFRRLSFGELSNLAIGNNGSGEIVDEKKPTIIGHANEALLRLYSRFVLRENSLVLQLAEDITLYSFLERFAQSNTTPTPGDTLYIVDTVDDPFQEDVIKVTKVTDENGVKLALNDEGNPYSLFTPTPNTLQVPYPVTGDALGIVYQARHMPLPEDDEDAIIELPAVLEDALTSYIAHKIYFHMNGQENAAKSTGYLTLFDSICQEVVDRDMVNSSLSTTLNKFVTRGFV